ncbi:DUF3667 domain-containing protein [Xanthomonadaceae bacterium XH05]|nr:DUF3667 domain-containing protein [Xanthomonadaceae bacterium XH05]
MVRHFSTIVGDFLDTVFDFDSRIARTLGPLLLRPGHLTLEYFRGHRVRYVTPVRLFFVLCIVAFLMVRFSVDAETNMALPSGIEQAERIEDVERLRDAALKGMAGARKAASGLPESTAGIEQGIAQINEQAQRRIDWLAAREQARIRGDAFDLPYTPGRSARDAPPPEFFFNGKPWHQHDNPISIEWLPERANALLNQMIGRARTNLGEARHDRSRLADAFFQMLPQSLFVLVPVFALVLKLAYFFTRRLYMEHLIVVLHSHAFLCAMLVLVTGTMALRDVLDPAGWVHAALGWALAAQLAWMPLYLLLTQKRVYGQGWLLTVLKFVLLGHIHFALMVLGLIISLAASLVAM